MSLPTDQTKEYCAQYCEKMNISCIGTAREPETDGFSFGGYFLVENNSYWNAKIELGENILGVIGKKLEDYGLETRIIWRLQAIQEFDSTPPNSSTLKLIIYRNSAPIGQPYNLVKETYEVGKDNLHFKLDQILKEQGEQYRVVNSKPKDLLICTHTERDRCCSRFGYPIYKYLVENDIHNNYKIWRSSHIGGHRMAATMIQFPSARYWAYMTSEITQSLIENDLLRTDQIDHHYRGLAGLSPVEQVAEGEALKEFGEEWLLHTISSEIVEERDYWSISLRSGILERSYQISKDVKTLHLGETRCAVLKPIQQFSIIE